MPSIISKNSLLVREYKRTPLEKEVVDLKNEVKELKKKLSELMNNSDRKESK